jgi:hypothetical protein
MVAWDQVPTLTPVQVLDLVAMAARRDASGVAPGDTDWSPTYDLNAAAAEGWRWKAAAVAGSFDFVTDSQRFDRSQVVAMCLQMSDRYRRRILASIRIGSSLPIIPPPDFLVPTLGDLLP